MVVGEYPKRRSLVSRSLERVIREAAREDGLCHGIPVPASVKGELDQIRGKGRPLPKWLAGLLGARFRRDFTAVRLHAGDAVDELAARFQAAAFCVGNDIFLHNCVMTSGSP